jgi:hypothetical protein
MHHHLKIYPEFFDPKLAGVKPWEVRNEDDRAYTPGDLVTFEEFDRTPTARLDQLKGLTGRTLGPCSITYCHRPTSPKVCIFTHTLPGSR